MVRPVRRDRHGRGLRGRLVPPTADGDVPVPLWRTRADRFDDVVRDAFDELEQRWPEELAGVELAVVDVPPSFPDEVEGLVTDDTAGGAVPLGRLLRGGPDRPARLLVYRRPVEARAEDLADLADLVHEVLVDEVAQLVGRDPDEVDPPT